MNILPRSEEMTVALARMLNRQPFFAVLIFDLLKIIEVDDIPTANIDGKTMKVNQEWFKSLTPDERLFLLAHEVMHVMLGHIPRGAVYQRAGVGPDMKIWDNDKAGWAMDIVINEWLKHIGLGSMPPMGICAETPAVAACGKFTMDDIWDEIYPKLNSPSGNGGGGTGGGNGGGGSGSSDGSGDNGFDQHDYNGSASDAPTPQEVAQSVASAMQAAKTAGKLHASLERFADKLFEPQVDWRAQLRTEITSRAGRDSATWARPNRRRLALAPHAYTPGRASERAGTIAAYFDTSGSIAQAELNAFLSEIMGIYDDCAPEALYIGDCAVRASDPEQVEGSSDIQNYVAKNSGGTHMPNIFHKLGEHGIVPDVCVVLTDGYTDFDEDPGFPVVWVMTTDVVAPYGKTIRIKV